METNLSYWEASQSSDPRPPLSHDLDVDVAIAGAGITGLTAAYLLAKAGKSVAIAEMATVASGTTGSTTGKVTSQHRLIYSKLAKQHGVETARRYALAQQTGLDTIERIATEENIDCDVRRMPSYVYTESENLLDSFRRELEVAETLGLPAAMTEDIGLPFPVAGAIEFDDQLIFHPRRYCLGLADAIERLGGRIFEYTTATGFDEGDPCELSTEHGTIRASALVVATQTPPVMKGLFFARTKATRSYAIAARRDDLPQGMYISLEQPTRSIRPHPGRDGNVLILGGGGHPTGRETNTDLEYASLESWARERFDMDAPEWRWSAQDFEPADGIPYVGPVAKGSKLYVATGFMKWGLTNGTAAALSICDAICGRDNEWAGTFAASRVAPVRSAGTVLGQVAETVRSIVGDRVLSPGPGDLDDLAPGDGTVVKHGAEPVAVYRDDEGALHCVSAVCTHLDCVVRFNRAERSWDCPCHGSRFDTDGTVLAGPATAPLDEVPVEELVSRREG